MTSGYYIKFIVLFAILVFVLMGAIQLIKWLQNKRYAGDMTIVDQLIIANNTTLLIVKVRGNDYFLGINGKSIQVLDTL
ncbi:flagellar biosynthetic protein FliO [Candidatus Marinamargulisbacteria bacterium]|jgi:flagellar biogenesis protein FliO|nr:flagellar biosynthetic protein FliO [Candidatus Marinamargulisbacteria bacterium]